MNITKLKELSDQVRKKLQENQDLIQSSILTNKKRKHEDNADVDTSTTGFSLRFSILSEHEDDVDIPSTTGFSLRMTISSTLLSLSYDTHHPWSTIHMPPRADASFCLQASARSFFPAWNISS